MSRSVSFKGPFIHKIMIRPGEFILVIAVCLFMGGSQIKECETLTKGKKEKNNGIRNSLAEIPRQYYTEQRPITI